MHNQRQSIGLFRSGNKPDKNKGKGKKGSHTALNHIGKVTVWTGVGKLGLAPDLEATVDPAEAG